MISDLDFPAVEDVDMKEGKEPNQGVAYLEDGTMVVDHARRLIGKNLDMVTSALQTTTGRLVFGRHGDGTGSDARPGGAPTVAASGARVTSA